MELFEEQEKTTLCNLELADAFSLCMSYVARYSYMLEIPVPVILRAIKMERAKLLLSGVDVERHITHGKKDSLVHLMKKKRSRRSENGRC